MGQRNHMVNGPLLKRLKNLNRMINYASSWKRFDNKYIFAKFFQPIKTKLALGYLLKFLILTLLATYLLNNKKS